MDTELVRWVMEGGLVLATAYGGVRAAMNGFEKRLDRIERKQDEASATLATHGARLAAIEVRVSPDKEMPY